MKSAPMSVWSTLIVLLSATASAGCAERGSYQLLDVESLGIPTQGFAPSEFRGMTDLLLWDGRIYIGHGDGTVNTGPTEILSFDPVSSAFINEFQTDDNAITVFRVLDGHLVVPGADRRSADGGSLYVLEQDGWVQRSAAPVTNHLLDVASYQNQWYVSTGGTFFRLGDGPQYRIGTVMQSPDRGESLTLSYTTPISDPASPTQYRVGTLATFGDRLYGFPFHVQRMTLEEVPPALRGELGDISNLEARYDYLIYTPDPFGQMDAVAYDGTRWTFVDLVPEEHVNLVSGTVFGNQLLLVAVTGQYLHMNRLKQEFPSHARTGLYAFDGTRSRAVAYGGGQIKDLLVRNGRLYLLVWKDESRLIAETEDLERWTYHALPEGMQAVQALEFDGASFYLGMSDGNLFRSAGSRPIASLDEVHGSAPRSLFGVSDIPRQGHWYWVAITAWQDWASPASVHATRLGNNRVAITVDNVAALLVFPSAAGLEATQPVTVEVNGRLVFSGSTGGASALEATLDPSGAWDVRPAAVSSSGYRPSARIVGTAERELTLLGAQPDAARWKADVYRWATGADLAFAHQWGDSRFTIPRGDVSLATVYDRLKNERIYTFHITGRDLRRMIEFNIRRSRSSWHVSLAGVRATFEFSDDPSENRVVDWSLDDDVVYTVAGDLSGNELEPTFGSAPESDGTGISAFSAAVRWFETHRQVRLVPSDIRIVRRP